MQQWLPWVKSDSMCGSGIPLHESRALKQLQIIECGIANLEELDAKRIDDCRQ
jgi:hypothetical protein